MAGPCRRHPARGAGSALEACSAGRADDRGGHVAAARHPLNFFTALIVIVFGFFFATVSSRMVGLIGSSNNPVSGMAIATLLISTMLLKATGNDGIQGMIAAIVIGGIICVIAAIAGDTSQDLKTGFLVGATPKSSRSAR